MAERWKGPQDGRITRGRRDPASLGLLAALTFCGAGPAAAQSAAAPPAVDAALLREHTRVLAHDSMEGRGTASRGEARAARYLAARLSEAGLVPLPGQSADYRLPVPLAAFPQDTAAARLVVRSAAEERTLSQRAFYHSGGAVGSFRDFSGELLFAGPTAGALGALASHRDLKGTVVVLGPPWDGIAEVEEELLRRGAEGAIEAISADAFFQRLRVVRGPTRYALPEPVADRSNQGGLPVAVGGAEVLEALGSVDDFPGATLEAARPLGASVDVRFGVSRQDTTAYSVAAMVPGADPALADEAILYVAHYDHVGFGEPAEGDSIWNGFLDNAAGTAILLEVARALAADPPARSVIFLFTTAEEQGLLGANWFAHRQPFPLERIGAVVNVDGGAPPGEPAEWNLRGAQESPAGERAMAAIERLGYRVDPLPLAPDSDHWPFHVAGVPALFLFPGSELRGVGEAEAEARFERWFRAHTPEDEWGEDFPFEGMARYAEVALAIGRELAGG